MFDNIAKTIKKLEHIMIDCCSDSDKYEQVSERQKVKLNMLKKLNEKDDKSVQKI